tara:strand:+ start:540 stop:884 length:345 start_codon:yes stop_codon:yes gene_type:complete
MGKNIELKEKFLEYFNEQEGFSLRSDRLYDDLSFMVFNPGCTSAKRMEIITKWMEAAYRQGARDMAQDTVNTLGDYATALAGIPEVVYTREEAYDAAKDNLMVYYTKVLDEPTV